MKDINAEALLTKVMSWDADEYSRNVPRLQLLAEYKYDSYQRYEPGKHFIESLSLWLNQFAASDRDLALSIVKDRLIFVSDNELRHLVRMAYPDIIVRERLKMVAEENGIPKYQVARAAEHSRFRELAIKSLYLGLSDGAHTNELRRASRGQISNEQIWQAYELGDEKASEMAAELGSALEADGFTKPQRPTFSVVWLVDDFSGSGNTYIRFDKTERRFKGKIPKVYRRIVGEGLVDPSYYEINLLLYVATRQAVDHIEYWSERFTSQNGYKPLQVRVVQIMEQDLAISSPTSTTFDSLIDNPNYFDSQVSDRHMLVGGFEGKRGFANCGLPLVLSHNTPNNSVFLLWAFEELAFFGLFPRVSRHREG